MHIRFHHLVLCSVASGTIFNDVLLWLPQPQPGDADVIAPVARLSGHEGSIHRLVWSPCGARLCSVSDDRTARVWAVAPAVWSRAAAGTPPAALTPDVSLFGHTGRVWDARFVVPTDGDDSGDELLATVSEDSTVRLWRLPDGSPRAALAGHRGRGIWRCALAGGSLATGGADGGVKLWRLADWLARAGAPAGGSDASGSETLALAEPPPPEMVAALQGAPDEPRAKVKDSSSEYVLHCMLLLHGCGCLAAANPLTLPCPRPAQVLPLRRRCVAAAAAGRHKPGPRPRRAPALVRRRHCRAAAALVAAALRHAARHAAHVHARRAARRVAAGSQQRQRRRCAGCARPPW
jgi:hypothetical protein